jgi:drug/metabolite transporter (DMT)-like permease
MKAKRISIARRASCFDCAKLDKPRTARRRDRRIGCVSALSPTTEILVHTRRRGLILAGLGAVGFSGKAIIVKLAYRYGVDAVTLIMYRMLFALPLFVFLAWWAGRGKPALTWRDARTVLGLGFCGYYLASFLDFAGLRYVSASLERLILYLNPTLVLALGAFLFHKKVTRTQILALAVSYCGVLCVFGREMSLQGADVPLGATLVFGSAVSYAIYLSYSGEEVKRLGALRLTGLATTVACLICIAQFLLLRPISTMAVPAPVLWLSVLNATLCTFAPVLMVMMAIERIGASLTAQAGTIGPLSTIFMAVILLGEPFTAWVAAGTVLVLAGIWLLTKAQPSSGAEMSP